MAGLLDPAAILASLPNLLPPSSKKLSTPHDGIAAILHTTMSAVGFRLVAVDDVSPARSILTNVLPDEWNAHGPGNYTFRYRHEQSSLEFVMKIAKLGGRTLVNAIAVESDKAASLDINTSDFVSASFYPHDITPSDETPLVHGFISSNRVADLMSQFKVKIIQNLIPGLQKDGYVEEDIRSTSSSSTGPQGSNTGPAPARPQPQAPPDAPDEIPFRLPSHIPPDNPLQIGRSDLDPLFVQRNQFAPPSLFPGPGVGGDGMFVGPDHPIFGARRSRGEAGGVRGPWGGDGFLPPMGAPPGARFDPVGPNIGPYPGAGGLGRGRGWQGGPGQMNRYDPDNDEFMPPGAGDMFS